MPDQWAWISGWGIQPERFHSAAAHVLPNAEHFVVPPSESAVDRLLGSGASHFGGYSLGSLLLLEAIDRIPLNNELHCLAPIVAFCEEEGKGGRTPEASLVMLERRFLQSPPKALKLFYRLADMADEPLDRLPYAENDLQWGLEALRTRRMGGSQFRDVECVIGQKDALLNAEVISSYFENTRCLEAGHAYQDLLGGLSAV